MKIAGYIDFFVQTLFLLLGFVITIGNGVVWPLLMLQLALGIWQLLSSIISVALRFRWHQLKKIHVIASAIYLILLFIFPFHRYSGELMLIAFTVPAWCLAVFNYIVTILAAFKRPARQSSFLPHTSF